MSNVTSSTRSVNPQSHTRALELLTRARQSLDRLPEKLLRIALSELEESVGVLEVIGRLADDPSAEETSIGIAPEPLHVWRPQDFGLGDVAFLVQFLEHLEGESYRVVRLPDADTGLVTTLSLDLPLGARELRGLTLEFVQSLRPRATARPS